MNNQDKLIYLSPEQKLSPEDLFCVQWHLDREFEPSLLFDERFIDKPFSEKEVFEAICILNKKRAELNKRDKCC